MRFGAWELNLKSLLEIKKWACLVCLFTLIAACGVKESEPLEAMPSSASAGSSSESKDVTPLLALPLVSGSVRLGGAVINAVTKSFELSVYPDAAEAEVARTLMDNHLADYRPTGIYAAPNEAITVKVIDAPAGTTLQAIIGHWNQKTGVADPVEVNPVFFALDEGVVKTISTPYGGPVYLSATHASASGKAHFKILSGGIKMPFVQLGVTTDAQWKADLYASNTAPFTEVLTDRSIVTFTTRKVREALAAFPGSDITAIAKKIDEMMASHDAVAGLNVAGHPIHSPRKGMLHATPHHLPDEFMFASNWHVAFCADECAALLFTNQFIKNGWGPWHEAGHKYQGAWEWAELSEVSVNLYSLEWQRKLGLPNRLLAEDSSTPQMKVWDNAIHMRTSVKQFDDLDVLERLVPLWQLRLAYGIEFWQTLHRNYRDPATRPKALKGIKTEDASNSELARQSFLVEASRAADEDLTDFFAYWKILPTKSTLAKIRALNLPKADAKALVALRPN